MRVKYFTIAVQFPPSAAACYFYRGLSYALANRMDAALADMTRSLEFEPDLYLTMAQYSRMYDDFKEPIALAMEHLKQTCRKRENDAAAKLILGLLVLAEKENAEAFTHFEKAGKLDQKVTISFYFRALSLFYQGKYEDAAQAFDLATEKGVRIPGIHFHKAACFDMLGDPEKALPEYESYLKSGSGETDAEEGVKERIKQLKAQIGK